MSRKIIITGDSWAMGEWTDFKLTHRGLEQYLLDAGHSVVNVADRGIGNQAALTALEIELIKQESIDCIIWFQTDPMRELLTFEEELPPNTLMPASSEFKVYRRTSTFALKSGDTLNAGETVYNNNLYYRVTVSHTVEETLDPTKLVLATYSRLTRPKNVLDHVRTESLTMKKNIHNYIDINNIKLLTDAANVISKNLEFLNQAYDRANKLGHKIYCIGGLSKIKLDMILNYPNLIPAIPSVLQMIYPEFQHAEIVSRGSEWRQRLMETVPMDHKSIDYFYEQNALEHVMISSCQEYFWPDGVHPNRQGHLKIYEKLKETIGI
jgi:hypothetical protein